MKRSEFYEKYWKIQKGGVMVSPPKLTTHEKEFLDNTDGDVWMYRKRWGNLIIYTSFLDKKIAELNKTT